MAGTRGRPPQALFLDTNVIIRTIDRAPTDQGESAARAITQAAEGTLSLILPDVIVAELAYFFIKAAALPRTEAAEMLAGIVASPGISVGDHRLLIDAIGIWGSIPIDFPDAYLAALSRRVSDSGVLSFDRDLDRIEGVTRVDPASIA